MTPQVRWRCSEWRMASVLSWSNSRLGGRDTSRSMVPSNCQLPWSRRGDSNSRLILVMSANPAKLFSRGPIHRALCCFYIPYKSTLIGAIKRYGSQSWHPLVQLNNNLRATAEESRVNLASAVTDRRQWLQLQLQLRLRLQLQLQTDRQGEGRNFRK